MSYTPIEDLPTDLRKRKSDLDSMAAAWRERRDELDGKAELTELHERLRRRWAVDYIDALEQADAGDLEPLIALVTKGQQREFGHALSVAHELADEQQLLAAGLAKAAARRDRRVSAYADVKTLGDAVTDRAVQLFDSRSDGFNERLRSEHLDTAYEARVFRPRPEQRHYYFTQIVRCARELGYFADTHEYRDWVRLTISDRQEERAVVLVVSVHSLGRVFKGILAAVAFLEIVDRSEGRDERQGPILATDEAFTFGYLDAREHVLHRFDAWLHTAWLSMLSTWQDAL